MKSRRRAREAALQALYQCDTLEEWTAEAVDLYFAQFSAGPVPESVPSVAAPHTVLEVDRKHYEAEAANRQYARALVDGVLANRNFLDRKISAASKNWTISRMARVDRNILRIACFEMTLVPEVPLSVSIDEAIELAKSYGGDESSVFINGVLDKIAKDLSAIPLLLSKAVGERQLKVA